MKTKNFKKQDGLTRQIRNANAGWSRRQFISTTAKTAAAAGLIGAAWPLRIRAVEGSWFVPATESYAGVVSSISRQASQIGINILNRDGNAVDAAVATVFALGVARPDFAGLGGAGMLLYKGVRGVAALDFQSSGPATLTKQWFEEEGMHQNGILLGANSGHRVAGVPGTVAGLAAAHKELGSGRFTLAELIAPAETLAREGFLVSDELATFAFIFQERLTYFEETRRIYFPTYQLFMTDRVPLPAGNRMVLEDYANSLKAIMDGGADAFYKGAIAEIMAEDMAAAKAEGAINPVLIANGAANAAANLVDGGTRWEAANDEGRVTAEDLAAYEAKWRTPLMTEYRGHQILTMPPSSWGGVPIIEMLNILEGYDLKSFGHSSADHLHVLAEAQKIAFADRRAYLADPDFYDLPVHRLTSKEYARERRAEIKMDQASTYQPGNLQPPYSHTNHMSVADKDGNVVAITNTMGWPFGTGVVPKSGTALAPKRTGFLLNNQIADWLDGTRDLDRPLGGARSNTNMCPTIVLQNGKPTLVIGGAGGNAIPMGVLQAIVNHVDFGFDIAHAIDAERIDAAVAAPRLMIEGKRIPVATTQAALRARGHVLMEDGDGPEGDDGDNDNLEYSGIPVVNAVGIDLATGRKLATGDPRRVRGSVNLDPEDMGALGQ